MTRRTRKLALNHETIRVLDSRDLRAAAGGVVNYDTSINHRGCSSATIIDGCFTNGVSLCGPCAPAV